MVRLIKDKTIHLVRVARRTWLGEALFGPRSTTLAWRIMTVGSLFGLLALGLLSADESAWAANNENYEACKTRITSREERAELDQALIDLDSSAADERENFIDVLDAAIGPEADPIFADLRRGVGDLEDDVNTVRQMVNDLYDPARNPDCEQLDPGPEPGFWDILT